MKKVEMEEKVAEELTQVILTQVSVNLRSTTKIAIIKVTHHSAAMMSITL
jgi:hypothetical protein